MKRLIDDILNDTESEQIAQEKGMCQKCGHYTLLNMSKMGMKVCKNCEIQMEQDLKRDFL